MLFKYAVLPLIVSLAGSAVAAPHRMDASMMRRKVVPQGLQATVTETVTVAATETVTETATEAATKTVTETATEIVTETAAARKIRK